MEPMIILPLAAFVILAVLFFLFLRRAGRLVAVTRDVERFRRQVADLAARIETSLAELCARVDRCAGRRRAQPTCLGLPTRTTNWCARWSSPACCSTTG